MLRRTGITVAVLIAGILTCELPAQEPAQAGLYGGIVGLVSSSTGAPSIGASVLLFDSLDRLVNRALTDDAGSFLFKSLPPGEYSMRVTLASFLPALKRKIRVNAGSRSLLKVSLADALSTIEVVYTSPGASSILNEDWKWVLRSSSASRPVLRYRHSDPEFAARRTSSLSPFSNTQALVKVSASDEGQLSSSGNQADLGTTFALATSLFGENRLQLSGNLAYSPAAELPSSGFRTSYSRGSSENSWYRINLTVRQLYLEAHAGIGLQLGKAETMPVLRTLSGGFVERRRITESLRMEYGFSLDSVSYRDSLTCFSPFGRVSYALGDGESVEFAYSSGAPSAEMLASTREIGDELHRDVAALAMFPRISLRKGQANVQRSENFELAYRRTIGSRTFALAAYKESVKNAALTLLAPSGGIPAGDLFPDLLSNSAVFNAGHYFSSGYMASVTQNVIDRVNLTFSAGSENALVPGPGELRSGGSEDLRSMLVRGRRHWAAMAITGAIPGLGANCTVSYRWFDGRMLTPGHMYLTQALRPDAGWNISLRQPIPINGMHGHLEATAELRNLLAEGYLNLAAMDGSRVLVMHSPRSLRGGLTFVF
jgi:hypothetical protein